MGLTTEQLAAGLEALAVIDPRVAEALSRVGLPEARHRPRGYNALLRTLIAQQISVHAARSIYAKLEATLGDLDSPAAVLTADDETLRGCGLSRPKISYARSLAEAVASGRLDFEALRSMDDEAAIAVLSSVRGFGRWSAEIYLLFAEGRTDIWPADDLALQEAVKRLMALEERPKAKATRLLAENWRPHRGAMAIFGWHYYAATSKAQDDKAPIG
ncbi:DNA-3-methyladenine glycosylase family protein [Pedomonas mirosovicensis]|uniref:DNA-3-methyladenine glycosylase family protein n=1 Tax=Pedomonas mirosovicensis TaxID=2908641 RepID=UPI002168048A|nr:DNA-3-methyladenine glycosylase 2 family protein [Pedomonas mirosovicensis]MCH8683734.1 DNA-3-methyladenine glycosylase 2 family protein [Pedomonas mirosovicensis]